MAATSSKPNAEAERAAATAASNDSASAAREAMERPIIERKTSKCIGEQPNRRSAHTIAAPHRAAKMRRVAAQPRARREAPPVDIRCILGCLPDAGLRGTMVLR